VQGDETFKLPANPSNMTVIEEDEEMMKESERENRNPSIGDDSLLYGSMLDGTYMNDTALLDQVKAIYKLFLSLFVDICAGS